MLIYVLVLHSFFFFFNDTATTEIYTLSLHDALPISLVVLPTASSGSVMARTWGGRPAISAMPPALSDRKSTRLNSSHGYISYAVFCLKKKKTRYTLLLPPTSAITRPGANTVINPVIA